VSVIEVAAGVGEAQLAELEVRHEKQHRLLRTLLGMRGSIEMREILRQLNSPTRRRARSHGAGS
jgi:hypothetical protein